MANWRKKIFRPDAALSVMIARHVKRDCVLRELIRPFWHDWFVISVSRAISSRLFYRNFYGALYQIFHQTLFFFFFFFWDPSSTTIRIQRLLRTVDTTITQTWIWISSFTVLLRLTNRQVLIISMALFFLLFHPSSIRSQSSLSVHVSIKWCHLNQTLLFSEFCISDVLWGPNV